MYVKHLLVAVTLALPIAVQAAPAYPALEKQLRC